MVKWCTVTKSTDTLEDCGHIIDKLQNIINGLDTLNGLHKLTKEQIRRKDENIVTFTLPAQANGLLPDGTENNLITFLSERLPTKYHHVIDFATKVGVKLRTEHETQPSTTVTTANDRKRKRNTDENKVSDTEVKKFRSSATQTSTISVTALDSLMNVCNTSILNVSAKKEEFEKKVELGLKLWDEQNNNQSGPWNFGLFYCYHWNKELFAEDNVTNIRCFTAPLRGGGRKDSTPCKLEHKCVYVLPSGNLCLSPDHTFMQHALFYDMPFSEAQNLHDCGVLTEHQRDLVGNSYQ